MPQSAQTSELYRVIRRNGELTHFDQSKITIAITKAFLAVEGAHAAASARVHDTAAALSNQVLEAVTRRLPGGGTIHIEDIQDQVELALMRGGHHAIARSYVLYREEHARKRATRQAPSEDSPQSLLHVAMLDGSKQPLDLAQLQGHITKACQGLVDVDSTLIMKETLKNVFDGIAEADLNQAMVMSTRTLIEHEPNYSFVAARLLLNNLIQEALGFLQLPWERGAATPYTDYFPRYIKRGMELQLLDPRLKEFDLNKLAQALLPERDLQFNYLSLQTLYDRYFQHWRLVRFELPQAFFMRVAMGLAINEIERERYAIEFYQLLSSFDFMSSTPTLFNSATLRPQLSSCYLTTIPDDLDGIYSAIKDNALLSKFAGGLGNDWTPVRAMGAHIKGTNGKSQGVVPFLKVANDTAVAVNQGGKRRGAVCAYLETWHLDIEEFLELRKNTGDERRRTHDMNTANWVPDLFMKRVFEGKDWTLFSPNETPDLHDLYGLEFEQRYQYYEALVDQGQIQLFKRLPAVTLWRKMLSLLFETGHPWLTFKDVCNLRSPQYHVGVVHSSNLCTEITLNTSATNIAVCNLGSINLVNHVDAQGLNTGKLARTVRTALRMLDNVIDINYYSVPQARNSNLKHRPVGLGIMGFQDALFKLQLPYSSAEAAEFADQSMEIISYYTIFASSELAEERGCYSSFKGSLWSQGILPYDSMQRVAATRNGYFQMDTTFTLDWDVLRQRVKTVGMRNSNCMAIAPTATISNICGVSQSIEPVYQNLFVKSNLSGEFVVVNPYLVADLKALQLWDPVMVNDLKYFDGSVQTIDRIPDEIKQRYACAFEIDAKVLVEVGSRRQKWIDQAQSLNLYMAEPSGPKLDELYRLAWLKGLKTTYYLRSMGATAAEKSTLLDNTQPAAPQACSIDNPDCEACQ